MGRGRFERLSSFLKSIYSLRILSFTPLIMLLNEAF